jgi:predicted nucleic acid-binding Zn ribbon protein
MMSMTIDFTCSGCGLTVKVMEKAVEGNRKTVCLTCGMPYRAEKTDGGFIFYPGEPPIRCECGAATFVPSKRVEVGYKFSCRSCKKMFQIVGVEWKYVIADDVVQPEPEEE